MYLFVGLGNPGHQYKNTKHNIGFEVIEYFINNNKSIAYNRYLKFQGIFYEVILNKENNIKFLMLMPLTYMNLSGISVKQVLDFYKISSNKLIVIHDDMDIKVGEFKIKFNGGSAGHNGIQSIINYIGKDFYRIRIGINRPQDKNYKHYVLDKFAPEELIEINNLLPKLNLIIENIVLEGIEKTISKIGFLLMKSI
ncbi:MAG: aminoacyl-tRNA hydrolase [bacterium]|nr:aminoacyl-tRNA hydrolase [bacterium]